MASINDQRKHWHEMTPEERVADQLRHFPTLLNRWNGGRGRFWEFTVSHQSLRIRLERTGVYGNLEIACSADYISGPVVWENAKIEISHEPKTGYIIQDKDAGVRVVGATVGVFENVKPVFKGL